MTKPRKKAQSASRRFAIPPLIQAGFAPPLKHGGGEVPEKSEMAPEAPENLDVDPQNLKNPT